MTAPNSDNWQWESGFTPDAEGEIEFTGTFTFTAEDDILAWDVVCFISSGSTYNYPNTVPTVCAVGAGNATDMFKTIGQAEMDASSGGTVTVNCFSNKIMTMKTNAAIAAGDWVRPSKWGVGEKMGFIYKCTVTGDPVIGIALNQSEVPTTAGTGTTASPFNTRPIAVLTCFGTVDGLNR